MQTYQDITKNTYNRIAEQWTAAHGNSRFYAGDYGQFKKFLPKGKIIDIGCGSGRDSKWFISNDYNYTGVDYSTGQIEQARENVPSGNFLQMDLQHLDFPDNNFDGFWAAASFLHIPKGGILDVLFEVKRVAKLGSIGFISLKKGEGERLEPTPWGGERFFAYYQEQEFKEILINAKFNVLESLEFLDEKSGTKWLKFFVKI